MRSAGGAAGSQQHWFFASPEPASGFQVGDEGVRRGVWKGAGRVAVAPRARRVAAKIGLVRVRGCAWAPDQAWRPGRRAGLGAPGEMVRRAKRPVGMTDLRQDAINICVLHHGRAINRRRTMFCSLLIWMYRSLCGWGL